MKNSIKSLAVLAAFAGFGSTMTSCSDAKNTQPAQVKSNAAKQDSLNSAKHDSLVNVTTNDFNRLFLGLLQASDAANNLTKKVQQEAVKSTFCRQAGMFMDRHQAVRLEFKQDADNTNVNAIYNLAGKADTLQHFTIK